MAASPSESLLLGHVRKLLATGKAARPDQELVERFARSRDERAFEALVHRHGPMVFRVCRRVLGRAHEAEDAFQATFLVLARKAGTLRDQASVSSWLYGVASRVALKARSAVRANLPLAACPQAEFAPGPLEELTLREARSALDEELARLPDKFRAPLVLCCLEGRARDEAAQFLGLPTSTLKSRLEQARELLRRRLSRRGLTMSAVFSASLIAGDAVASVPVALAQSTARYAVLFVAGNLAAEAPAAAGALALAKGALNVTPTGKLAALAAAAVFALALAGTSAAFRSPPGEKPGSQTAEGVAEPMDALARRLWSITELVAKHHPEPPARADMLAATAKAVCKEAKVAAPADVQRRAEEVTSPDQLAAFLKAVWPAGKEKPTAEQFQAAALKGLLHSVPGEPHLLTMKEVRVNGQLSANRYVGIGIQIAMDEKAKRAFIVDPFRKGTAYKAGVKPKDLIVRVEDKDTEGVPLMKVVDWLRGEEGTSVKIEVRQPGEDKGRTYTITRAPVPLDTVFGFRRTGDEWSYRIDPSHHVGYLRVGNITSSTLHELRQAERRLRTEGVRAVVIDLRFSQGGGELHTAELVAGSLLDRKVLWRVRDAKGEVKEARSGEEVLFRGWPMAFLVNEHIASAAGQAVAAAMQDAGRATIVGERTKTDGAVRSLLSLPEGEHTLVLRTGSLERAAKGRGWPLEPDHAVALDKERAKAVMEWLIAKERSETPAANKLPEDPQLGKCVELLAASLAKEGRGK